MKTVIARIGTWCYSIRAGMARLDAWWHSLSFFQQVTLALLVFILGSIWFIVDLTH